MSISRDIEERSPIAFCGFDVGMQRLLSALGAPGCSIYGSMDLSVPMATDVSGYARFPQSGGAERGVGHADRHHARALARRHA